MLCKPSMQCLPRCDRAACWRVDFARFAHTAGCLWQDHGTDFSRVRDWVLNGFARHYRQTLLFTSGVDADCNAIFRKCCSNMAVRMQCCTPRGCGISSLLCWLRQGAIQVRARYSGAVSRVVTQVRQVFHRLPASSAADAPDARFDFFCKHLLPQLANDTDRAANQAHTLLFVPSYYDYVRLRNILTDKEASYSVCSEYVGFVLMKSVWLVIHV